LFPAVAAQGQDKPSDTVDEAVRLLEQAKREFESALAMAERQNKALITTIQSQAQTIADLKLQLADCQARLPGESSSSVPRLGIFTGTVRSAILTEFIKEGAVHIHLLAHHQIGYPHIDEDLLRTSIESMIPVDKEVYACIDVEGAYLTPLMECAVGSAEYEADADEYIKAMTIAREMRPKAKWT